MAEDDHLSDEDIRAAARHWLAQDHWKDQISRSLDGRAPGDLRREHHDIPRQLLELDTDEQPGVTPLWARRHEAAAALETAGYPEQSDMNVLDRTADVMIDIIREQVEKRMQEVFRPEVMVAEHAPARNSATPTGGAVLAEKTPVISENVERWLIDVQKPSEYGQKGIPAHHAGQKRVSVRLLTEIIGDRPAGSVSREDAAAFRLQLLRLPASHGKGRHVHALEAIAKAAGTTQKKFQMKTVKRHFSAIKGYWEWLRDHELIPDAPIPFTGHKFPGTKSGKSNRDDWSIQDLERLFKSADYRASAFDSAFHWLPLIALHSGMRLEEIARLRTKEDIVWEGKVACFKVQPHPDGWDPKTEAGERSVPIHSWLVEHGLMKLVERRLSEGCQRLFPDLSASGESGSFGAGFSRDFSRLKIGLGIGSKTVFHSFRHTFRTEVESSDIKERFIDAVMGHEGPRGEGATYAKRVALSKRREVVEFFHSPLPLDFINGEIDLPPRRVRKVRLTPRISK